MSGWRALAFFPLLSSGPTLFSTIPSFWDRTISLLSCLFSSPSSLVVSLYPCYQRLTQLRTQVSGVSVQSGRSPHGGGQRHVPVLHSSCLCVLVLVFYFIFIWVHLPVLHSSCLCVLLLVLVFFFFLGSLFSLTCFVLVVDGSAIWAETAQDFAVTALQSGRSPHKISPSRGNHKALALCHGPHSQCAEF